ncbi:unnamed protein product [Rotaria sp. Silwood2]|nr:unnamed protein product [Rotaria sp. Silwood2]
MNEISIDNYLKCPICTDPFLDPVSTPCEHTFCRQCILTWLELSKTSCPSCRETLSKKDLTSISVIFIHGMLNEIQVKCTLCGAINLQRGNFQNHINNLCPKADVSCSTNSDTSCSWIGSRDQLEIHQSECQTYQSQLIRNTNCVKDQRTETLNVNRRENPTNEVRLVEEAFNTTAIESFQNSNIENIQFSNNDDELNRPFSTQGYAIRRRQKSTKTPQEHQQFFIKLFHQGENTGKKVTVEDSFQKMRRALKSDNTKLFTTNQYLTKNQIRSIFSRLSKKGSIDRRSQFIHNNENDQKQGSYEESTNSDEDDSENYFKKQQDEELEDLEVDEIDNALKCCSDNEYDRKKMDQSYNFLSCAIIYFFLNA